MSIAAALMSLLVWAGACQPGPVVATGPTAGAAPVDEAPGVAGDTAETVVLLHGLGRTERSMARMAGALEEAGYRVVNLGYPSRDHAIEALADSLAVELERCCATVGTLHFVTHSMGGILVRAWVREHDPESLGRVVMLSPPNQGSDVAERLPEELVELLMGPAALQLGTDSASVPVRLPPVEFELGVIAGDASLNPLFSSWLPGEDDGMVAVESAWVDGATAFMIVPYTHTFIMYRDRVIEETLRFLETGRFSEAHVR